MARRTTLSSHASVRHSAASRLSSRIISGAASCDQTAHCHPGLVGNDKAEPNVEAASPLSRSARTRNVKRMSAVSDLSIFLAPLQIINPLRRLGFCEIVLEGLRSMKLLRQRL